MRKVLGLLWEHKNFRYLWVGQTISLFGTQITLIGLPLVAAISLKASPLEMGILQAVGFLPFLILSLFAGVWVDRKPKRPILICADIVRAMLLVMIPLGWYEGFLSMPLLLAVAFLIGIGTVFFDIGSTSYLPFLIGNEQLAEGNSKLEFSSASATVLGQSIGGALIQIFSPPFAITFDVISYVCSALFLGFIRKKETIVVPEGERQNIWSDIGKGTTFVFGNEMIRAIVLAATFFNLFTVMMEPIFILYITRTLRLEPVVIGLIFSSAGAGALVGAFIAMPVMNRLGIGKTLISSLLIAGLAACLIPVAVVLPTIPAVILIIMMYFLDSVMLIVFNINQRSLRSAITPDRLQGRMNASIRFLVMGVVPIGNVLGGLLGGLIGTTLTLLVGAIGIVFASVFIISPSIRRLRIIPEKPVEILESVVS